ncbi:MAG: hypothetical protein HS111_09750 [Kofleriaceae bacterium]|nr:hypothetical protein [Kofleriaceae bacterium]
MACEHLPPPPLPFRLVLPGAGELVAFDLGAMAQPALAPLMPFFRLLDAVVKAVDVLRAIPDALSVPPDPTQIAARLPALLDAAAALTPLAPPASVPVTAVSLIDAVIEELRRTRGRVEALDGQARRIERAKARAHALDDLRLAELVGCAEEDLVTATEHVLAPLEALGTVLSILGLVLGVAGGPPLPPWLVTSPGDRAALVQDLLALEHALADVRARIPLPS